MGVFRQETNSYAKVQVSTQLVSVANVELSLHRLMFLCQFVQPTPLSVKYCAEQKIDSVTKKQIDTVVSRINNEDF